MRQQMCVLRWDSFPWAEPYSGVLNLHQAKQNGVKHFKSLHVQRNMQMDCSAGSYNEAFIIWTFHTPHKKKKSNWHWGKNREEEKKVGTPVTK